jgi:serine/threonine protein kinase
VYQGRKVAYKVLNGSVAGMSDLQKEVSLHLKVCGCPGVVQILAVSLQADAMCEMPCVVMERAMGSLADFLFTSDTVTKNPGSVAANKRTLAPIDFTLPGKLTLVTQVASALEYISAAGLVHRDIKTSNILLFDVGGGNVTAKICDFGLSKSMGGSLDTSSHVSIKGTPMYLAPETYRMQYSTASDVYAFAITFNELMTECAPVPTSLSKASGAPGLMQLVTAVCTDGDRPEICAEPGVVGEVIRRLIRQCWHQDPQQRCSFAHITSELPNILQAATSISVMGSMRIDPLHMMKTLRLFDGPANVPNIPVPVPAPVNGKKQLSDLTVSELSALLEAVQLDAVKDVLASHKVTGRSLSYCEDVEDLLAPEFGLSSKGLARGLMEQIKIWKVNGL